MKIFEYHQHEFGPRNVHCRISYSGHITFDPELHTLMSHIQPPSYLTGQHLLLPQARKYSSSCSCSLDSKAGLAFFVNFSQNLKTTICPPSPTSEETWGPVYSSASCGRFYVQEIKEDGQRPITGRE